MTSLLELLHKQLEYQPDSTAIICENHTKTSYKALYRSSQSIANKLLKNGIKKGDLVALYLPRSLQLIEIILALLSIGAKYLPIDLRNPQKRISYVLKNSQAGYVVTSSNLQHIIDKNIITDTVAYNQLVVLNCGNLYLPNKFDEKILYVIYTSGSTGHPKGVLGTEIGLINRIMWMQKKYPTDSSDSMCFNTSFSFVDAVAEMFFPLISGIKLYIPNANITDNPLLLTKYIHASNITRISLGPAIIDALIDHNHCLPEQLQHVKILTLSGQELTNNLAEKIRLLLPAITLINLYGSTEVAADALYYEVPKHQHRFDCIPIGVPIDNMGVCIHTGDNQFSEEQFTKGEICIYGIGLSMGYLGNKQKTDKQFIPYTHSAYNTVYLTGDFGYFNDKQEIVFCGRIDNQIKLNGQKIDLRELEFASLSNPIIANAFCVFDKKYNKLVLFTKMNTNQHSKLENTNIIREHLESILPHYMLPHQIMIIDQIPLNTNGKVDRNALLSLRNQQTNIPMSASVLEAKIIEIFQHIFDSTIIYTIDTDFFSIGGDSLTVHFFVAVLEAQFHIHIRPDEIYSHPRIKDIAQLITQYKTRNLHNITIKSYNNIPEDSSILVLFPPITGFAFPYQYLIDNYQKNIVTISCDNTHHYTSLEELALACWHNIQNALDNKSNIVFAGWSFGGVLAYACSNIAAQNQTNISKLIFMDSLHPNLFKHNDIEKEKQELYEIFNNIKFGREVISNITHNLTLLWDYTPPKTSHDIVLCRAKSYNNRIYDILHSAFNGWEAAVNESKINICQTKFDHFDMLSPSHAKEIASMIKAFLFL